MPILSAISLPSHLFHCMLTSPIVLLIAGRCKVLRTDSPRAVVFFWFSQLFPLIAAKQSQVEASVGFQSEVTGRSWFWLNRVKPTNPWSQTQPNSKPCKKKNLNFFFVCLFVLTLNLTLFSLWRQILPPRHSSQLGFCKLWWMCISVLYQRRLWGTLARRRWIWCCRGNNLHKYIQENICVKKIITTLT